MRECACVWGRVRVGGPSISLPAPHQGLPMVPLGISGERSQASDSVILKTCSFTSLPQPHHSTPLQKTPHPNNEIKKKSQKANPAQRSKPPSQPRHPLPRLPLTSPSLLARSLHPDHLPFLQRPLFWERNCTHFVSNTMYFSVNSSTAPKEIRRRAGRKGKRVHPQNE